MRSTIIVFLLLIAGVCISTLPAFAQAPEAAQPTVDIDTIGIARLYLGEPWENIYTKATTPIDTMIWSGPHGANVLRFAGSYLGHPGNVLVATAGSVIRQLTFNFGVNDSVAAATLFEELDIRIEKEYGNPSETYTNIYRMLRWNGRKHYLMLQTKDGTSFVSVVLNAQPEQKR